MRYNRNDRREARSNWTGEVNGVNPTGNYLFRINNQVTIDHVWTMSSGMLLNLRGGYAAVPGARTSGSTRTRSTRRRSAGRRAVVQYFEGDEVHAAVRDRPGRARSGRTWGSNTEHGIWSFQPTWTKVTGAHNFRGGLGLARRTRSTASGPARSRGRYDFNTNYTRQFDNSPSAATGQQLAAMLLGQPTGGIIDRSADR